MEKTEKKEKQQRKKYAPAGERGQVMTTFRLDSDLVEWLKKQANKGRYINNLIRAHRDRIEQKRESNEEYWPDERESTLYDYQP